MLETVARLRELGQVLNAENVQRDLTFMCRCRGGCCNVLRGISRHGHPNAMATSNCMVEPNPAQRSGGGHCSRDCLGEAIDRVPDAEPRFHKFGRPAVGRALCVGCGVRTMRCKTGASKHAAARQGKGRLT